MAQVNLNRDNFDAGIFDLDGVITQTASTHAAAWKRMFDAFLQQQSALRRMSLPSFDIKDDYLRYVDGKPRNAGVASFLTSRHLDLPYGSADDPPEADTVVGLGKRKNLLFLELVKHGGVEVYPSSVHLLLELRKAGLKTAVVSSSANTTTILRAVRLVDMFDAQVDGVDLATLPLQGKPAPDAFLEACTRLGVTPQRSVVFEDAISGVQAGRAGGFGCVIGIDRHGHPQALAEAGADAVVSDLAEVQLLSGPFSDAPRSGAAQHQPRPTH